MALNAALSAAHALASNAPQQPLALIAVSGRGGGPHLEVVRRGAGDGVNESLEGLLVDVDLLQRGGGGLVQQDLSGGCVKSHDQHRPVLRCAACWTSGPT